MKKIFPYLVLLGVVLSPAIASANTVSTANSITPDGFQSANLSYNSNDSTVYNIGGEDARVCADSITILQGSNVIQSINKTGYTFMGGCGSTTTASFGSIGFSTPPQGNYTVSVHFTKQSEYGTYDFDAGTATQNFSISPPNPTGGISSFGGNIYTLYTASTAPQQINFYSSTGYTLVYLFSPAGVSLNTPSQAFNNLVTNSDTFLGFSDLGLPSTLSATGTYKLYGLQVTGSSAQSHFNTYCSTGQTFSNCSSNLGSATAGAVTFIYDPALQYACPSGMQYQTSTNGCISIIGNAGHPLGLGTGLGADMLAYASGLFADPGMLALICLLLGVPFGLVLLERATKAVPDDKKAKKEAKKQEREATTRDLAYNKVEMDAEILNADARRDLKEQSKIRRESKQKKSQ